MVKHLEDVKKNSIQTKAEENSSKNQTNKKFEMKDFEQEQCTSTLRDILVEIYHFNIFLIKN